MADAICRWRNPYYKTVREFIDLLPREVIKKDIARQRISASWTGDFFHTPYQLACQLGLYYEDEDSYYPRFKHDPSPKELNEYLRNWIEHYCVPNPYTRQGFQGLPSSSVHNEFCQRLLISQAPIDWNNVLLDVFKEDIGNKDILKNTINTYSEVIKVDSGMLQLQDGIKYSQLTTYRPNGLVDRNDKAEFFNLFAEPAEIEEDTVKLEIDSLFEVDAFYKALLSTPLSIQELLSYRFVASLLAKRFLILTGLSGSGKTKLAQAFVKWISSDKSQYKIVPVAADWTNREPLFGYPNALDSKEYVKPESGVLDLILQAIDRPNHPHFLVLDEMNLSHVERYFADFLSGLESGEEIPLHKNELIEKVRQKLELPKNLFVIGTVNIDETTYMFSPKVLDRANVIEFRVSDTEIEKFLNNPVKPNLELLDGKGAGMGSSFVEMAYRERLPYKEEGRLNEALMSFFNQLKLSGAEFGYRTAHEIHRLAGALQALNPEIKVNDVVDICIMQKLLPKVHGSRKKMVDILKEMSRICVIDGSKIEALMDEKKYEAPADVKYPMSLEKLHRMYRGAIENGFTSFAEA